MYRQPYHGKYKITCIFGKKGPWACGYHIGVDYVGLDSKNVYPIADGKVVGIRVHGAAYGNNVVIQHNDGMQSLYAHFSQVKVKLGQKVATDTIIGVEGSTGHSSGSHCHIELRKGEYFYPKKGVKDSRIFDVNKWIESHKGDDEVKKEIEIVLNGKKKKVTAIESGGFNFVQLQDLRCDKIDVGFEDNKPTITIK